MAPLNGKRTRLSIGDKLEALRMLRGGYTNQKVIDKFNISERTVRNIKSQGDKLLEQANKVALSTNRKSLRQAKYAKIDTKVLTFCELARTANLPVTLDVLIQRALLIKDEILKDPAIEPASKERVQQFRASKCWAVKFVRRHALKSVSVHGQGASVDISAAAADISELRRRLGEYEPCNIYNVDETGLFFKLLPRRTYILPTESRRTLRGTKKMSAKDRITAYICSNADGSKRVSLGIIGKSKNPRCFKSRELPDGVTYFSNKTAWSNGPTFRNWFYDVFLPFIRRTTSRKVALIVDNASSHVDLRESRNQVNLIPLPPNVTAVHQPMDLGIIAAWKRGYRKLMLREVILEIETRKDRRLSNKSNVAGTNGLAQGYDPNMMDVLRLSKEAWDEINEMTLARCWLKSDILPVGIAAEIRSVYGHMKNKSNENETKEVTKMLQQLKLGLDEKDPLRNEMTDNVTEEAVERWMDLESEVEIQEAIVHDAVDEIERNMACIGVNDEDDNDSDIEFVPAELPSLHKLYEAARPLEQLLISCGLRSAGNYVKRAVDVARREITKENGGPKKQMLITDVLRLH